MNLTIIIGRLGRTPELKRTAKGIPYTRLSIATQRYVRAGEPETTWHNVTVWGKQAEHCCRFLEKGRQVAVHGRLETRRVENDGDTHYYTNIVAEHVQFLDAGRNAARGFDSAEGPSPRHRDSTPRNEPDLA